MIRTKIAGVLVLGLLLPGAVLSLRAQAQMTSVSDSNDGAAVVAAPPESATLAALPDAPAARTSARPLPAPSKQNEYAQLSTPLSPRQKFLLALNEAFWPGTIGAAAGAGISMATDSDLDRGYGMEGIGFTRRFLANFGENATDLMVGDFVIASIGHQDPRYHPSPRSGFGRRLGWAISRVFVTQSDAGAKQLNYSHLLGMASGAAVSNAWHRDVDRGAPETAQRFGWDLLSSAIANVGREFWDFRHAPRQ
ncbi:MAG: hypothetical protein GZ088_14680 [Acidipila sp.]|nr:hypothetical protein [Acidipila sp.]